MMTGAVALTALAALSGCRGQASKETPIVGIRGMYDQPRYEIQSKSEFFEDHRTMRMPVEGTVAREAELDPQVATGRNPDDTAYVATVPDAVLARAGGMAALVERGQDRFNIYCAPCHDKTGSGHGMVVKRGMLTPPTFHQDRIRHIPDGQLFATISNGIRNMPAYGIVIPIQDRWAIVSYVRALQLSQEQIASSKGPTL
jgi:mono/diheme cytochrome c family protein